MFADEQAGILFVVSPAHSGTQRYAVSNDVL
jgi:hypothetical protein